MKKTLYIYIYLTVSFNRKPFESYKSPKLTHEEIDTLNSSVSNKETEFVVKAFPQRKHYTHIALLVNSTKHLMIK